MELRSLGTAEAKLGPLVFNITEEDEGEREEEDVLPQTLQTRERNTKEHLVRPWRT